jgi:haloacetate dehalogenase
MMTAANVAPPFFAGFRALDTEAGGVRFAGAVGGEGPPVLLLHGYPQTHAAWRRIAPELAREHTVIIPDLPGYGASRTLDSSERWTKRRAGRALAALMTRLGHPRFAVVGHDRGARAGYRLALDHPARVSAFVSLTVVPTSDAMAAVDFRYASRTFHWFFLAQEADLPERLLAADPDAFIDHALRGMTAGRSVIEPAAMDAYRAAFRDPSVRHAICEDYRAALDEDLLLDFAESRAGHNARRFLGIGEDGVGGWRGTLICDDYAGYKQAMNAGVTEAGCLAHARRKFHELWANHSSTLAEQALKLFGVLYDVEREVKDLHGQERLRIRQLKSRPAADLLHAWMVANRQKLPDGSATAKAIDYSLKRWAALTRFIDNGDSAAWLRTTIASKT